MGRAMAEAQSELEKRGMVFNEPDLTSFTANLSVRSMRMKS